MRLFAFTIAILMAIAFLGLGSTASLYAADPGACQASDCAPADCALPQGSCASEREPGVCATLFDRFVNPNKCEPHWGFSADAVVLQRSTTRDQILFADMGTGDELLNAKDFNSKAAIGFQLGAIRHGPCGWDVELGYFQIDGWKASTDQTGDLFMATNSSGDSLIGVNVTDAHAEYKSALRLAEINLRRQWCDGLTLLSGFRAGELDEIYSASGNEPNAGGLASIENKTFNHLYGFQIGADWEFYNMGGPLRISAVCKSGIYDNVASQTSTQVEGTLGTQTLEGKRDQAMFMGEVGAVARYDVNCHLSLRASCQAMWLEGVALAPEQIMENDFRGGESSINTHGGIFAYGGGLGLEYKF